MFTYSQQYNSWITQINQFKSVHTLEFAVYDRCVWLIFMFFMSPLFVLSSKTARCSSEKSSRSYTIFGFLTSYAYLNPSHSFSHQGHFSDSYTTVTKGENIQYIRIQYVVE